MAVVSLCGWESGNTAEVRSSSGTASVQGTTVRTGAYALRINPTTTAVGNHRIGGYGTDGRTVSETNVASLYARVYARIATAPGSGDEEFIGLWDSAGTSAIKLQIRLNSSRQLVVYDNTTTLVATGSTALALDTWYRIEVYGTTSGSASAYEVRIDGATELSGTCTQGSTNHGSVRLGKNTNRSSQSVDWYFDDFLARDDDWCGPGECKVLVPDGDGSTAQWTSGTAPSNYTTVDEVPTSDTDYLQKSAAASQTHYVTFASTASQSISGTINAVKIHTRQRESASGTSSLRAIINSGGTTDETSGHNGSTTVTTYAKIYSTDPDTSAAWTTSAIDALEGGAKCTSATSIGRCTGILLFVDYDSTQNIATNAPSSGTTFFNATVSATANIVTNAPSAGTAFYNATVSAGNDEQTITTNAPVAGTEIFNAAVTASASVATAAPAAGSVVYNPAATASADIATAAPASGTQFFAAAVTNGVTIVTDVPVVETEFFNATVTPGAVEVVTNAPVAGATFYQAAITASATVATNAPVSGAQFFNATVTPGAVTIATAAPASATEFFEATVGQSGGGEQSISTASPSPTAVLYQPTVTATADIVTAAPGADTTFFNASVTPGGVTIVTAAPSPTATIFEPEVTQGAASTQTVTTAVPSPSAAVYQPSVSPGAVAITTAAPSSGSQSYQPAVSANAVVAPEFLTPGTVFYQAAVAPGAAVIVTDSPAPTTQIFAAVLSPSSEVVVPLVVPSSVISQPAVVPGEVVVSAALVPSGSGVFAPEVSGGIIYPGITLEWSIAAGRLEWASPADRLHYQGGTCPRLHWSVLSPPLHYTPRGRLHYEATEDRG